MKLVIALEIYLKSKTDKNKDLNEYYTIQKNKHLIKKRKQKRNNTQVIDIIDINAI
jgi:hypothetical protein